MADLAATLPENVELGAVRRLDWNTQVVPKDSGGEVRNNRWTAPLRTFEIAFPIATREDADYLAVKDLYEAAEGMLYSFMFTDWVDDRQVEVRFDAPLEIEALAPHLDHIVGIRLKEVR